MLLALAPGDGGMRLLQDLQWESLQTLLLQDLPTSHLR